MTAKEMLAGSLKRCATPERAGRQKCWLFVVLSALVPVAVFGDAKESLPAFPSFAVSLGCQAADSPFAHELDADEREVLRRWVEFTEAHADEIVHLAVQIGKPCSACECARARVAESPDLEDAPTRPPASYRRGSLYFDRHSVEERRERFGLTEPRLYVEGVELMAFLPQHWSVVHVIYLPRYWHLSDPQYRYGGYGDWLRFDGLFTARYGDGTGVNSLHFDPVVSTEGQRAALARMRAVGAGP